jgi:hypothetical protein
MGFLVETLRKEVTVVAMILGAAAAAKQHVISFTRVAPIANGS